MIDAELVKSFNEHICNQNNQQSILLNENNLLSALSVQQWFDDTQVKACAIFRSLIQGHPFQDGNKRTAVLVLMYICEPHCSEDTLFEVTLNVAKGYLKDPQDIASILYT